MWAENICNFFFTFSHNIFFFKRSVLYAVTKKISNKIKSDPNKLRNHQLKCKPTFFYWFFASLSNISPACDLADEPTGSNRKPSINLLHNNQPKSGEYLKKQTEKQFCKIIYYVQTFFFWQNLKNGNKSHDGTNHEAPNDGTFNKY